MKVKGHREVEGRAISAKAAKRYLTSRIGERVEGSVVAIDEKTGSLCYFTDDVIKSIEDGDKCVCVSEWIDGERCTFLHIAGRYKVCSR